MQLTAPLKYRTPTLWLNGIALVLTFGFALGEASWHMFGPKSYGPIVFGILAPVSVFLALTVGRRSAPVLFTAMGTSCVLLVVLIILIIKLASTMLVAGLSVSTSEWVMLLFAFLFLVALLGNIAICLSLWHRRAMPSNPSFKRTPDGAA
jgi:hypothetical protein